MNCTIFKLFIGCFLFTATAFAGEKLLFKVGDRAHYTITRDSKGLEKSVAEEAYVLAETKEIFELELLSVDPLQVSIQVKEFFTKLTSSKEEESFTLSSQEGLNSNYERILSEPLHFQINGPFDVVELTGVLEELEKAGEENIVALFEFTLFLERLFHLADRDIEEGKKYPYGFVKPLGDEGNINQVAFYQIKKITGDQVEADFYGEVTQLGMGDTTLDTLKNSGAVSWDRKNPLIQQRSIKSFGEVELVDDDAVSTKIHFEVVETQVSRAL